MHRRDFLKGATVSALMLPAAAEALTPGQRVVLLGGAQASAGMPPAPPGFHWVFVTYNMQPVSYNGVRVVAIVANGVN